MENRIVNRMQKMAEGTPITDAVKRLPKNDLNKIINFLAHHYENFIKSEVEKGPKAYSTWPGNNDNYEWDSLDMAQEYYEHFDRNDVIELVQDYLNDINDEQLNKIGTEDLEELKQFLFNIADKEMTKTFDKVVK